MTREQAEANWIWDPERGDTRPKEWPKNRRMPCTLDNVLAQKGIARPGTLIHTASKTNCPRKKAGTDVRSDAIDAIREKLVSQPRKQEIALSSGKVTHLAVAGFIENVNCLWCRRDYFRARTEPPSIRQVRRQRGAANQQV